MSALTTNNVHSAGEVLATARAACEPVPRAAVESVPGHLRRLAGYQFGWWDVDGIPSRAGAGKSLRAALVLVTLARDATRRDR